MSTDQIGAAYRRTAEQVTSDEHLLGALPDDASRTLLDWTLGRLQTAAATAPDVAAFDVAADAIRRDARSIADAASAEGGDPAVVTRLLQAADAARDRTAVAAEAPLERPAAAASDTLSSTGVVAPAVRQPAVVERRGSGALVGRRGLLIAAGVLLVVIVLVALLVVLLRRGGEEEAAAPPSPPGGWYEVLFTTPAGWMSDWWR